MTLLIATRDKDSLKREIVRWLRRWLDMDTKQPQNRQREATARLHVIKHKKEVPPVGFEPTHPKISELESDPLDRSGKAAL